MARQERRWKAEKCASRIPVSFVSGEGLPGADNGCASSSGVGAAGVSWANASCWASSISRRIANARRTTSTASTRRRNASPTASVSVSPVHPGPNSAGPIATPSCTPSARRTSNTAAALTRTSSRSAPPSRTVASIAAPRVALREGSRRRSSASWICSSTVARAASSAGWFAGLPVRIASRITSTSRWWTRRAAVTPQPHWSLAGGSSVEGIQGSSTRIATAARTSGESSSSCSEISRRRTR